MELSTEEFIISGIVSFIVYQMVKAIVKHVLKKPAHFLINKRPDEIEHILGYEALWVNYRKKCPLSKLKLQIDKAPTHAMRGGMEEAFNDIVSFEKWVHEKGLEEWN